MKRGSIRSGSIVGSNPRIVRRKQSRARSVATPAAMRM